MLIQLPASREKPEYRNGLNNNNRILPVKGGSCKLCSAAPVHPEQRETAQPPPGLEAGDDG